MYLLVSAICLVPLSLAAVSILVASLWLNEDRIELLTIAILPFDCLIFTSLFVYAEVLKVQNGDLCEDDGNDFGAVVISPLYSLSAIFTFFTIVGIGFCAWETLKMLVKQFCCCFGGTVLIGSSLAKIPYDKRTFGNVASDCAICLGNFCEKESVSPLHCDIKHLFHTECIRAWLVQNPVCPLCKATISPLKLKLFKKDVRKLLKEQVRDNADEEATELLGPKFSHHEDP